MERVAADERDHYERWMVYTHHNFKTNHIKVWLYTVIVHIFGFTFAVKLMEKGEKGAQENYAQLATWVEEATAITEDENTHEDSLLALLEEEKLR